MKTIAVFSTIASLLITATAIHLSQADRHQVAEMRPEIVLPQINTLRVATAGDEVVLLPAIPLGIQGADAMPTVRQAPFEVVADAIAY